MIQLNGEFGESGPCIVQVDKFDEVYFVVKSLKSC